MKRHKKSIEEQNESLLVHGDDTEVSCEVHNFHSTFGKLSDVAKIALLNGLDQEGDICLLSE